MTRIVIDKENEITKLENMLETLTDEKDKQSVRFAINVISGFNEVLSERLQGEWITGGKDVTGQYFYDEFICNKCFVVVTDKSNFCPNCGADMRGVGSHLDNTPTAVINKDFYKTDKSNPINRSDLFQ